MKKDIGTVAEDQWAGSSAFPGILPETRAALDTICRIRTSREGQTVVREDEITDFVGCVLSGIMRIQKTLADGRQHIVGLLVEGALSC